MVRLVLGVQVWGPELGVPSIFLKRSVQWCTPVAPGVPRQLLNLLGTSQQEFGMALHRELDLRTCVSVTKWWDSSMPSHMAPGSFVLLDATETHLRFIFG